MVSMSHELLDAGLPPELDRLSDLLSSAIVLCSPCEIGECFGK